MRVRQFLPTVINLLAAVPVNPEPGPTRHDKSPLLGQRDLGTVQTALGGINAALARLDAAIVHDNFSPCILPLVTDILTSIQNATTQIQASPPLMSLTDASDLKATTDGLTANVNLTVSDLIKDLSNVKKLGLVSQVAFVLQTLRLNAVGLANIIASRVPAELSSVAAQAVQDLESTIDRGIAAFNVSSKFCGGGRAGASPPPASSLLPSTSLPPTAISSATPLYPTGSAVSTSNSSSSSATGLVATLGSSPLPRPTASNSSVPQSPEPAPGSFGGVSAPLPVPGSFVPGQSCFCKCPAIAQLGDGFLLVGP